MGFEPASDRSEVSEQSADETLTGAIGRNPVAQTLAVMMLVSILGWSVTGGQGAPDEFMLSMPIAEPWWSLLTATYGHLNPGHLLSNAVMVAIAGGVIALSSSAIRFHLFFLIAGAVTAVGQVYIADIFGTSLAVIGSSGSAFALAGYVIGSVSARGTSGGLRAIGPLSVLCLLVAGAVTIWFSPPGTAFGSHFIGVLLGLVAGRLHLLRVE